MKQPGFHAYVDSLRRNLCDICDRWQGAPLHQASGRQLRDQGMARAAAPLEDVPWRQEADRAVRSLARSGQTFSAEDVTAVAGRPIHPNAVGALLSSWKRRGLIEPVGFGQAERRERHASRMLQWRGVRH